MTTRLDPRAHTTKGWGLLLAASVAACAADPIPPPSPPADVEADAVAASRAEELVRVSGVESIVTARASAFTRSVAFAAGDLSDFELERLVPAVTAAYSADALRADIVRFILAEDPGGRVDEMLAYMMDGANREVRDLVAGYDPPLSMPDFMAALEDAPPALERLRLLDEWNMAVGGGTFFVLVGQALDEAANSVLREFRPSVESFVPLSGDALFARLEQSDRAQMLRSLHEMEQVPAELLRRATAEYHTDAGRWWVETYSLAVAEAIRSAGERVVARLATGDSGRRGWIRGGALR